MILIVIIFFALTLFLTNPIIGFLKAKSLKANIAFSRCLSMSMRKTLKTELIKAVAFSQEKSLNIGIDVLEAFSLAGGSPLRCLEGMEYAKSKNIQLDFNIASAVLLSGKDIIGVIDKTDSVIEIQVSDSNIKDSKLKETSFAYTGNFKIGIASTCFATIDYEKIENEVKEKLQKYIQYADTTDRINTGIIIKETILDSKFWDSKGLNLISQTIRIN